MRYKIQVAGKLFVGDNPKVLLRRAVEAKRAALKASGGPHTLIRKVAGGGLVSTPSIQPAEQS
jgi:hypothetical protein